MRITLVMMSEIGIYHQSRSYHLAGAVYPLKKALPSFVGHTVMAMVVSVALALVFDLSTRILLTAIGHGEMLQRADIEAWYGPLVWGPGLVLGFFVNRHFRHRTAYLTWLPGLTWIVFAVLTAGSWHHDWSSRMAEARIDLFPLKKGECGTTECLGVLLCTWPFGNALTYSIGAAIALICSREKSTWQHEKPATSIR